MSNPLLQPYTGPNDTIDFDLIKLEHYMPAIEQGIREEYELIETLRTNKDAPTFENTIEAMEFGSATLEKVLNIYYNMLSVRKTAELHGLNEQIVPLTAKLSSDISSDPVIFSRVKAVYDMRDQLDLTTEQKTVLENSYIGFVRGGALLPADKQERLKEINERLGILSEDFKNNRDSNVTEYFVHITDKQDLDGVPNPMFAIYAEAAKRHNVDGWALTLEAPLFMPFMMYGKNRNLREKLWRAYGQLATKGKFDNQPVIKEIVSLRAEKAALLGGKNYASFVLERRMAENTEAVDSFLHKLADVYLPAAKKDFAAIGALAKELDGIADFMPWDSSYYSEKLKQRDYDYSEEDLRPYFKLEDTLQGTFDHFTRLFNVSFAENKSYPVWHKDVTAYDVVDNEDGRFLGTLYADFFPRPDKKSGAWQSTMRSQGFSEGELRRPVVSIVCNFTPSTEGHPSLLTFDEVSTLFHEMGHAMHNLLADTYYPSASGTSVKWDFVELPSQLQENWCYEPETLSMFAKHYETGESLPETLLNKLRAAKNFMVGSFGMQQVRYGLLDMAWHTADPKKIEDVQAFERKILEPYRLFPLMDVITSTGFSHIFGGGYAAGYYSYKWAEVLDADAFEAFLEHGLYDQNTAHAYRYEVLAKGGSDSPGVLYHNFRGRDADPDAVLRREGVLESRFSSKSA